jgi:hypothetical protein
LDHRPKCFAKLRRHCPNPLRLRLHIACQPASEAGKARNCRLSGGYPPFRNGSAPPIEHIIGVLEALHAEGGSAAWQKALSRAEADLEGALAAARTFLESVCLHILGEDELLVESAKRNDLPKLYRRTSEMLKLALRSIQSGSSSKSLAGVLRWLRDLRRCKTGYEMRMAGVTAPCACHHGMRISRLILLVRWRCFRLRQRACKRPVELLLRQQRLQLFLILSLHCNLDTLR